MYHSLLLLVYLNLLDQGFDKKIEELKKNKSWNVKEFFKSDYIASKDVNAWLCLAEVTK